MPVISKIGSRSRKVRLVYAAIFGVLILGATTMVYPFMLMLAGSVRSDADSFEIKPYPQFWFDDVMLFRKYVESKHNVDFARVSRAWWKRIGNWGDIQPPSQQESQYLDDFLAWRKQCKWWSLGHTGGQKMLPIHARQFRKQMYARFDGDISRFRREMGVPLKSWSTVIPPPPNPLRYPRKNKGIIAAFREYAAAQPIRDRVIGNTDGEFREKFLVPKYTPDIGQYNARHETSYSGYGEVFLTARVPAASGLVRQDWEEFVREVLPLQYIRLAGRLAGRYRRFLAAKYGDSIEEYNANHARKYASFEGVAFSAVLPADRSEQVDWQEFIFDRQACPADGIEVYGPRQAFEEFVAKRRGVPVEQVAPIRMPIAAADWHDCMANTRDLRWEFTTRNYKHVLDYLLLHGRGIPNTIIYCTLAISLALLVNPLAAYALSRYKLPSTYTILLFCMATMAFPVEVTMIPAFLLLKRFPLWPLVGGAVALVLSMWILSKVLKRLSEKVWMSLALGISVLVGAWLIPAVLVKPHISLLNTFAALVMPTVANGYMIFLLKGFFDSLPRELYEAADIDGASEWTKFWSFTMALSKPILAVVALRAFTLAYSQFMMALIIIPDEKMWTIMVWLFQLQSQSHQAVVMASLVVAAIPTFMVFVFCQGIIMRGIVVPVEK